MSAEWRELTEDQKQVYKNLENADRERYNRVKAEWDKTNKIEKPTKKKGKGQKAAVKPEEVKAGTKAVV
jgi:phage protein D